MKRSFWVLGLLFIATVSANADDGQIKVDGVGGANVRYETVDYTRELWVGLNPQDVKPADMLKTMREVCDDTTSVAVITISPGDKKLGNADELEVLASLSAKSALSQLNETLKIDRKFTRVVLVGLFETCATVLRIACDATAYADGLVLIDPPVGDVKDLRIPRTHRDGVDVLLHPRSDSEFDREREQLTEHLDHWGETARFMRAKQRQGTFRDSLAQVWNTVRGYAVANEPSTPARKLAPRLADYEVVFVGELHGNPGAHRVELEFLRHFIETGKPFALATEHWERDTQQDLNAFLAGEMEESEFIQKSRAWPNYADYRPLLQLCKQNNAPVIAGNIPRRLANRVYKEGVDVLGKFSDEEKSWCARELNADTGAYKRKFMDLMGGMGGATDALERMYAAQCIKDDTMAESISEWLKENPGGRVLHINGAFHSAGGLGVPEKLMLMSDADIAMVTCVQAGKDIEPEVDEWLIEVPAPRSPSSRSSISPHD